MNHTPLEDQVHDALARRVEPLHPSPLTLDGVRRRARRIQLRRRVAAGAAVAAALAVALPLGLALDPPSRRSEQPPVDRTPVVGTVRVDPRSATVGAPPQVPLVDVAARSVTLGDLVVEGFPKAYDQVVPYGGRWLAARQDPDGWTVDVVETDLDVEDHTTGNSPLAVSPDGTRVAWASFDRVDTWFVINAATAQDELERPWARVDDGPQGSTVGVVGFVSDDEVLVHQLDDQTGTTSYLVADRDQLTPYPGLEEATSASPATGRVAGRTTLGDGRSCAATFDATARSATPLWTDCDHELGQFSPDGSLLAAFPAGDPGAGGDESVLSLLDASTGQVLVDFEVTPVRDRVVGIATQVAWEDDESLLATYTDGDQQWVVRLGTDGSVERVAGPATVDLGTLGLRLNPGRPR